MNNIKLIFRMLKYFWRAQTIYSAKAPKLHQLMDLCVDDHRQYYIFEEIDYIRKEMAKNHTEIEINDLGAGSRKMKTNRRKISSILKTSVSPKRKSELLYRLSLWQNPNRTLELGTCLGISAKYLSHAVSHKSLTTVEGDPSTYQMAKVLLKSEQNISVVCSDFKSFLELSKDKFDFIYLDGHHDGQATIDYVNQIYPLMTEESMLILDDVYWTLDMNDAWKEIQKDPRFSLSVDLFQFGILFKSAKQKKKTHHVMIQKKYKPWKAWI